MIYYFLILILSLLFTTCRIAEACNCGCDSINGPGLVGPIITIPAFTLPKGKKFIGFGINYTNFDSFSNARFLSLGKHGQDVHNFRNVLIPSLSGGYGITDNWYIALNAPYVFRFNERVSDGPPINVGSSIGFGDIAFSSAYRFLKRDDLKLHAALLAGIKIPSGVRRLRTNQGDLFEADDQPGTGSWDPSVGLAVSKVFKNFSLTSNGLYKFSTQGTQHTTVGDIATFNLGFAHRVRTSDKILNKIFSEHLFHKNSTWDLVLEGNGQWVQKPVTNINGMHLVDKNHGGLIILLSPGMRLIINKLWITNLSVGFPVIEELNHFQKGPNVRLILNFTRVF